MGKRKYENEGEDSSKKSKQDIIVAVETKGDEQPQNEAKSEQVENRPARGSFDVKQFRKEISGKQGQTMGKFLFNFLFPDPYKPTIM